MRELTAHCVAPQVRLLVLLMPDSAEFLTATAGRVSEDNVRRYLDCTFGGDAPKPAWGLPGSCWEAYLAGTAPHGCFAFGGARALT